MFASSLPHFLLLFIRCSLLEHNHLLQKRFAITLFKIKKKSHWHQSLLDLNHPYARTQLNSLLYDPDSSHKAVTQGRCPHKASNTTKMQILYGLSEFSFFFKGISQTVLGFSKFNIEKIQWWNTTWIYMLDHCYM